MVALFFGRQLERTFPVLITVVAFVGSLLALAILFYSVKAFRNQVNRPTLSSSLGYSLPLLTTILLALAACETLILLPIERIHFLKYAALAGLIPLAKNGMRSGGPAIYFYGFLAAALVGSLEESAQAFVPERFFDLRDIGLNVTGALFGALISWLLPRQKGLGSDKNPS